MTIVRVGLAENKSYGEGWDAIFGGGKSKASKKSPAKATAKKKAAKSTKKKK